MSFPSLPIGRRGRQARPSPDSSLTGFRIRPYGIHGPSARYFIAKRTKPPWLPMHDEAHMKSYGRTYGVPASGRRGMTIDIRDAYRRALNGFANRVLLIQDDQWSLTTPCADWSVRDLVNHVVNESLWAPELLAGRTVGEVGDAYDGDLLGGDPVKAFEHAAHGAVEAVYAEGALTATTHLSFGDVPGEEYITELFADALIHTWDLARAIGVTDLLDPELVAKCTEWFAGAEEGYRQSGVIGDRLDVPANADAQTRLLAAWGRRA
jgi:uncharacterized protein (TIGR03086 family)